MARSAWYQVQDWVVPSHWGTNWPVTDQRVEPISGYPSQANRCCSRPGGGGGRVMSWGLWPLTMWAGDRTPGCPVLTHWRLHKSCLRERPWDFTTVIFDWFHDTEFFQVFVSNILCISSKEKKPFERGGFLCGFQYGFSLNYLWASVFLSDMTKCMIDFISICNYNNVSLHPDMIIWIAKSWNHPFCLVR